MLLRKREKGHPSYRSLKDGSVKVYLRDGTSRIITALESEVIRNEVQGLTDASHTVSNGLLSAIQIDGYRRLEQLLSGEIPVSSSKRAMIRVGEGNLRYYQWVKDIDVVNIDYGNFKKRVFIKIMSLLEMKYLALKSTRKIVCI